MRTYQVAIMAILLGGCAVTDVRVETVGLPPSVAAKLATASLPPVQCSGEQEQRIKTEAQAELTKHRLLKQQVSVKRECLQK